MIVSTQPEHVSARIDHQMLTIRKRETHAAKPKQPLESHSVRWNDLRGKNALETRAKLIQNLRGSDSEVQQKQRLLPGSVSHLWSEAHH